MRKCGVYETWKIPGVPEVEEAITATKMKTLGAVVLIRSASRQYRIEYQQDRLRKMQYPWPWLVLVNHPVGSRGAVDNWVSFRWYASLKEARTEARKFAQGAR